MKHFTFICSTEFTMVHWDYQTIMFHFTSAFKGPDKDLSRGTEQTWRNTVSASKNLQNLWEWKRKREQRHNNGTKSEQMFIAGQIQE